MCSIFGFVARADGRPKASVLRKIVGANLRRGPHAFGFAWLDVDGRLHAFRQAGKITDHVGLLTSVARDATMLIGHLRYATHGDPAENINNHPHPCDGGWIVHNGVISNDRELIRSNDLMMSSECDSEVLALLMELGNGSLITRTGAAVAQTRGNLATLGLWSRPGTIVVARRGNPLHVSTTDAGLYIATLAEGMPGQPRAFADDTVRTIKRKGDEIVVVKQEIIDDVVELEDDTADAAPLYRLHQGNAGEYRGG
jgi:glucosamine--fructose-6-phosphate aminotransferase (isomerizing)